MAIGAPREFRDTKFPTVRLTAGPSRIHPLTQDAQRFVEEFGQTSHRDGFFKEVLANTNGQIRKHLGGLGDNFGISHGKGGTHRITAGLGAMALTQGMGTQTLVVNTDAFSSVTADELTALGRPFETMTLERGTVLTEDSEQFAAIRRGIEEGTWGLVCLTGNGTTTGGDQMPAAQSLVKHRNETGSSTQIFVDNVSGQIIGREWDANIMPDYTMWWKDLGVGSGYALAVYNMAVLERARALEKAGVNTGGKDVSLLAEAKAGPNQQSTTPPNLLLGRLACVMDQVSGGRLDEKSEHMQRTSRNLLQDSMDSTDKGLGSRGFSWLTGDKNSRSNTAHVIRTPDGITGEQIVQGLAARGIAIATGYGDKKKTEVRVCVYSPNEVGEVIQAIDAMNDVVDELRRGA